MKPNNETDLSWVLKVKREGERVTAFWRLEQSTNQVKSVNQNKFLIKNLIQSVHILSTSAALLPFNQVYLSGHFEIDISFKDWLAKGFVILYKLVNSIHFRDIEIDSIYATRWGRCVKCAFKNLN